MRSLRLLRELRRDKGALAGAGFLGVLVVASVCAPFVAPYDPAKQSLADRLRPPFWQDGGSLDHPLGTDGLGRDVLSRLIFGSRTSLLVGALVVLIAGVVGTSLGLLAGYRGGHVDSLIMRIVDTQFAFPGLLLAMTVITVTGPSVSAMVLVLSLLTWMVFARVTRSTVLSVREEPYVEAAKVVGCKPRRIVLHHILPNLTSPLLTLVVLEFAHVVLAEAAISFLGLGVQPPSSSWGLDISVGRDHIFEAWWLVTLPGVCIALTVLATNLLAGWLRVAADPQEGDKRFAAGEADAATVVAGGEQPA